MTFQLPSRRLILLSGFALAVAAAPAVAAFGVPASHAPTPVAECMAGEVRYVGRLLVEVPQRVSRGKEYRYAVENAREATLMKIAGSQPELAKRAVDAPMRPLEEQVP